MTSLAIHAWCDVHDERLTAVWRARCEGSPGIDQRWQHTARLGCSYLRLLRPHCLYDESGQCTRATGFSITPSLSYLLSKDIINNAINVQEFFLEGIQNPLQKHCSSTVPFPVACTVWCICKVVSWLVDVFFCDTAAAQLMSHHGWWIYKLFRRITELLLSCRIWWELGSVNIVLTQMHLV